MSNHRKELCMELWNINSLRELYNMYI